MKFLYPPFLFALLAVAIPLIIHFFNFKRYKTVYFSNVNFLKAVKKDSRKKSQLKHILILISRILVISFLVFAFSQPYIPLTERGKQQARQAVAVYIDNSFSMRLEGEQGISLEQAKIKAIEIANSYRQGTQFILLTNDFLPQHRFLLNREQFIRQLGEIKVSPNPVNLSQVVEVANKQFKQLGKKFDKSVYLLSDFQKNNFNFQELENDGSFWSYLIPFTPAKTSNLFVDSCWFEVPGRKTGKAEKLVVKIVNASEEAYQDVPVRFFINDSLKAISNVSLEASEEKTIELSYTNNVKGFQLGKVELDDYPITYDNSYYIAYEVKNKVDVLAVFEAGDRAANYFRALFANDDFIFYEETLVNNLQLSRLKDQQCIFLVNLDEISSGLANEITNISGQLNSLVVFPSANAEISSYNQLFERLKLNTITALDTGKIKIDRIDYNDILFKEVFKYEEENADLPELGNFFHFSKKMQVAENELMIFRNGQKALARSIVGNCNVYTFAFPADTTNIGYLRHPVLVPSVYNIALNSTGTQVISRGIDIRNLYFTGRSKFGKTIGNVIVRNTKSNEEFIVTSKPTMPNQLLFDLSDIVKTAGHYQLLSDTNVADVLAYNYKRNESEPEFYAEENIVSAIEENSLGQTVLINTSGESFKESLEELNNGKQLWKWFLLAALLFILAEMLIIRLWK